MTYMYAYMYSNNISSVTNTNTVVYKYNIHTYMLYTYMYYMYTSKLKVES